MRLNTPTNKSLEDAKMMLLRSEVWIY